MSGVDRRRADVLIVGAGAAGLSAARQLQASGAQVLVLEKERAVGGRLATEQIGNGFADVGAQFFTVRTADFRAAVEKWLEKGLVYEWSRGWSDGSLSVATDDRHPRYAATDGFSALAEYLAAGLDVRLNVHIVAIQLEDDGWMAMDQAGQQYHAPAVLLTPPVPESLALLKTGRVQLAATDRWALEQIDYTPTLCGLFLVEGQINLPEPGAMQRPTAPLSWIADNRRKGISPGARVITVHANDDLSRVFWDVDPLKALATLRMDLELFLDEAAVIRQEQLKRWRYAKPATIHPERYLLAQSLPLLIFAGDAFGGPRIEGAVLSGWAAAGYLQKFLTA
jgi:predicted NAD/FAD-dependent oxidoreductase